MDSRLSWLVFVATVLSIAAQAAQAAHVDHGSYPVRLPLASRYRCADFSFGSIAELEWPKPEDSGAASELGHLIKESLGSSSPFTARLGAGSCPLLAAVDPSVLGEGTLLYEKVRYAFSDAPISRDGDEAEGSWVVVDRYRVQLVLGGPAPSEIEHSLFPAFPFLPTVKVASGSGRMTWTLSFQKEISHAKGNHPPEIEEPARLSALVEARLAELEKSKPKLSRVKVGDKVGVFKSWDGIPETVSVIGVYPNGKVNVLYPYYNHPKELLPATRVGLSVPKHGAYEVGAHVRWFEKGLGKSHEAVVATVYDNGLGVVRYTAGSVMTVRLSEFEIYNP